MYFSEDSWCSVWSNMSILIMLQRSYFRPIVRGWTLQQAFFPRPSLPITRLLYLKSSPPIRTLLYLSHLRFDWYHVEYFIDRSEFITRPFKLTLEPNPSPSEGAQNNVRCSQIRRLPRPFKISVWPNPSRYEH